MNLGLIAFLDAVGRMFDDAGYRVELLFQVILRLPAVWHRRALISDQL